MRRSNHAAGQERRFKKVKLEQRVAQHPRQQWVRVREHACQQRSCQQRQVEPLCFQRQRHAFSQHREPFKVD